MSATETTDPTVAIVCRELSHEDAPVTVAVFDYLLDPRDGVSRQWIVRDGYKRAVTTLVGDEPWRGSRTFIGDAPDGIAPLPRVRFRFRCSRCSLSVERHGDVVYPALDTLAAAGVSDVSLSAVGAIFIGSGTA